MSNNVALSSWPLDSPLSNLSTPSQADDSASTTNDRIFFGPLQSPEKKYAMPSSGARFRTPVRRSTRLSAAMVPLPLFPETVGEDSSTREGTPEEDGLPDEPSIILASRVLSACSNPSPPPSPPILHQSLPELDGAQLADTAEFDDEQDANLNTPKGSLITLEGSSEPIPSSPLPPVAAFEPPDHQGDVSQPDLINFDSFSAGDAGQNHIMTPQERETEFTVSRLTPKSVDDLLSMSPHPPSTSSVQVEQVAVQEAGLDNDSESTANPDEEMEVVSSLAHTDGLRAPSPLLIDITVPSEDTNPDVAASTVEPAVNNEQTPPLRRSTRPRRSRSSLPQTVTSPPPRPTPPKKQSGIDNATESDSTPQPQERKRKAEPSPAQDQEEVGDEVTGGIPASPKGLPQLARVHRELGSLSPMSSAVLSQLLPRGGNSASGPSTPLPPPPTESGAPISQNAVPATPPQQSSSFVFPKVATDTGGDVPRPKSPLRPFSPSKFAEGSRTPARRIPIAQAVADGTLSSQKLPGVFSTTRSGNAPGSPVFKKLALDDPGRSPARRVPLSEALPVPPPSPSRADKGKGKAVFRPQSPVRPSSARERSTSVEPQPAFGRKERGTSAEPSTRPPALGRRPLFQKPASFDGTPSGTYKIRTALPFPLTGQQRLPLAIPEAEEPGPSAARPAAAPVSPVKPGSSLRQPSAGSGSKIPRIGAKPYARPRAGTVGEAPSKLPTPAKARIVTKAKPLRIVNVGSSSGSSSDEGVSTAAKRNAASAPNSRRVLTTQSSASSAPSETGLGYGLKRKREAETAGTKPSATGGQQVLVMRKVVPGMFNKGKEGAPVPPPRVFSAVGQTAPSSPVKLVGPIKARSALDWKKPQPEGQPPPVAPLPPKVEKPPSAQQVPPAPPAVAVKAQSPPDKESREHTPPPPVPSPELARTSVPTLASASLPAEAPTDTTNDLPRPEFTSAPAAAQTSTSQTQRRSTRSKRVQTPTTDVFGSVVSTSSTRPLQSRRRRPLPSETSGPFAGMTALALKTLTSANTIRNQQQVVVIQTEVIRKEGPRPDSPTTRVRSALEKEKEERIQQRHERAERRARRSAGSDLDIPPDAGDGAAVEGMSDGSDACFMTVDRDVESEAVLRHRRGPGDEEDYDTPPRPERPAKRGRFEGGSEEEAGEKVKDVPEKRVKWDKGLHTTVILHDTPPKPKWDTKAVPSKQSCLTPAAKSLRLDTLGNVLNAEAPLGGLVKENVVVKKFVFDDDVVPEVEPAAPPPPPPVKSTRSKKSKSKS